LFREPVSGEGHEGEDAAFAFIVGAEDADEVFDADEDDEGPEDERDDSEDVSGRGVDVVRAGWAEAFAQRVDGAGADVAEDDAEGGDDEGGDGQLVEAVVVVGGFGGWFPRRIHGSAARWVAGEGMPVNALGEAVKKV
jgi:hypothetical protein